MANGDLPLLLFPQPAPAEREGLPNPFPKQPHRPTLARQAERLMPKFAALLDAMDQGGIVGSPVAENDDPDLVLVLETVGAPEDFMTAAEHVPGLEWLFAEQTRDVEPDEDFFYPDEPEKRLGGKVFLMGASRQALVEIRQLWQAFSEEPTAALPEGLGAWKQIFPLLKDVRFWNVSDRRGAEVTRYWADAVASGAASITFEIEAWCFKAPDKNAGVAAELSALVQGLGGTVRARALIPEIRYHGMLVELPSAAVQQLLGEAPPELALSARVMFFRPRGQAVGELSDVHGAVVAAAGPVGPVEGTPRVAVLDGLPLANHPRLAGRVMIDDPDDWAAEYQAAERQHGTAVVSLIAWGDMSAQLPPLTRPLYCRPIMHPDPVTGPPRVESTPAGRLVLDLVHSAVRRIFEGPDGTPGAAPSVKVINISVGDAWRSFDGTLLSPWARLLDWLACEFNVLFIVSAGNSADPLVLQIPRETVGQLERPLQVAAAVKSLIQSDMHRRLLAPAESLNALTVGSVHSDAAVAQAIPGRHIVFEDGGLTPYSCIGPGFRRAIKPDVLFAGGRVRYSERLVGPADMSTLDGLWNNAGAPGLLAACPPTPGGADSAHVRGSSYSAALATRAASQALDVLDALRAEDPTRIPEAFDAVLVKALLVHGASWGNLYDSLAVHKQDAAAASLKRMAARYAGYGYADVHKAFTCSEQRATLLGFGELQNGRAIQFTVRVPACLHALPRRRRLTITLAWLSPVNALHSRYRVARLWVDPPTQLLALQRREADWQQVRGGTVQHEILEGDAAVPIVEGDSLVFTVNCKADAGRLLPATRFGLCATLEVAEELQLPLYQQVREQIAPRAQVHTTT